MTEFTGERVIPGEVNPDLWAEHLSRYAFATRYAAGKQVLDIGCGTGYGSAELAKSAARVIGVDVASEAVVYAQQKYASAKLEFRAASAAELPFDDHSFDLVTAFEVIEHLNDWRAFLVETKRVLRPGGVFFVSTPNKLYYAESREKDGPNPFHVHEFEFAEFQGALTEFFPRTTILLQNWHDAVTIVPASSSDIAPAGRIESPPASPNEAHFFIAMCSTEELPKSHAFLYLPSVSNLLRDREHHIRALSVELTESRRERDDMIALHAAQKLQLEESNAWAERAAADWRTALERVAELQQELRTAQTRATEVAEAYARKVSELEEESRQVTAWAAETDRRLSAKCDELAETVTLLDKAESTVIERTLWAQTAQAQLELLRTQIKMIRESRWVKLGRSVGIGPEIAPDVEAKQPPGKDR